MPDLDNELAAVRSEMRGIVHPPTFGDVIERSRRRATRRWSVAVAAAAAVAVAVALPVIQSLVRRADPPAAGPLPGHVTDVDFADPTHGYALLNTCLPGPRAGRQCDWHVAVTLDGASWQLRAAPELDGGSGARVVALGGGQAIIEQEGKRWFSRDGKRWQQVPGPSVSSVNSIPDGSVLRSACAAAETGFGGCANEKVFAVEPDSGRMAPLANQPAVARPLAQAVPTADGGWWVYGEDPVSHRPALAVSTDAGRSWAVTVPPELPGEVYSIAVVRGPDALYAAAEGMSRKDLNAERRLFLGMYRSVDGGRNWEVTWRAATDQQPSPTIVGMPVVTVAGHVLVASPGRAYTGQVSRDGGRTFAPDGSAPPLKWVSWTRGGYLNMRQGSPERFSLSRDGVSWQDVDLP